MITHRASFLGILGRQLILGALLCLLLLLMNLIKKLFTKSKNDDGISQTHIDEDKNDGGN